MNEFETGKLIASGAAMDKRIEKLEKGLENVENKIDILLTKFAEANGGWKALTILTSIAVAVGAIIGKFITIKFGG